MQHLLQKIRNKEKLHNLRYYDIIILTIIFFGSAIYDSTLLYIDLLNSPVADELIDENLNFADIDHWRNFFSQSISLIVALLYLYFRNFDFSRLKIKFNAKVLFQAVIYFIIAAVFMDIYFYASEYTLDFITPSLADLTAAFMNLSTVIYALLNGLYEEIFFLGFCLCIDKKYFLPTFIYALIIRWSFHTYQGMDSAIGIGFVYGLVMYFLYKNQKEKNLLPLFLAHSIADILGLSICYYII